MSTDDSLHWPLVAEYLAHAEECRLVVPECEECGESHFPPRVLCPYCLSSVKLRESAGRGTVYAFTVVHLEYHPFWEEKTPYINALIDLDDGPVMFANLIDCEPDDVAVGDIVTVTFEEIGDQTLPMFTPDSTTGRR